MNLSLNITKEKKMQLSEVNNVFQHKITGGGDYGWNCYDNPWTIEYASKYAYGYVIFNIGTGEVYEVSVSPNSNAWNGNEPKPYRWLNPNTKDAYYAEAKKRKIDPNVAWDDVTWIDLETEEDFCEKASAMFKGETFDTRIQVPIELEDNIMLQLCMEAHKRDITLNEMVKEILLNVIVEHALTDR